MKDMEEREQRKVTARAERKSETHSLEVGAILYASWGYDQTNIEFYQVVEVVSDKTIKMARIASRTVEETSWCSSTVVAVKDSFLEGQRGGIMTKRADKHGRVRIASYASATPWNGKPLNCSWGH